MPAFLGFYLLVTCAPFAAQAAKDPMRQCLELFSVRSYSLDHLINLEKRITTLQQSLYADKGTTPAETLIIEIQIEKARTALENSLDVVAEANGKVASEVEFAEKALTKGEDLFLLYKNRNLTTDYSLLLENPLFVRSEYLYKVNGLDPLVQRVLFSETVVRDLLWDEGVLYQHAAKLILRGILRGRAHATETSGIVPFSSDKSVFKMRIVGRSVGAIRVSGYFNGSDFYIVAWSQESGHGPHASKLLVEKALADKKKRFPGN